MSAKALFLTLTTPLLPWVVVDFWIQSKIQAWAEDGITLSVVTRILLAADLFIVRYLVVAEMAAVLLSPLLAVALSRALARAEPASSEPQERFESMVSRLGWWILLTLALTVPAASFALFAAVKAFGVSAFLKWSALVGLLLTLALTYRLQDRRFRAGRTRLSSGWLVALIFLLNVFLTLVGPYLVAVAFYLYGRRETARSGVGETASALPGP